MKFGKIILILALILIVVVPISIYIIHFNDSSLSNNSADWGNFGSYINGVIAPLIAILGIIITYVLSDNNKRTNETIIKRKEMEQRPLLYISYVDYLEKIRINISNKGLGPAYIISFNIVNIKNKDQYDSFYDVTENIDIDVFDYYTGSQVGVIMGPNEKKKLFEYTLDDNDKSYEKTEKIRHLFSSLRIEIKYKDIYEEREYNYERSLEWFGRNL